MNPTDTVRAWIDHHPDWKPGVGLGNGETDACSIAQINLALTGTLTDDIPDCMSEVIGSWIIVVQDSMSNEIRCSAEWRNLLPLASGTGRELEQERLDILLDWMWETGLVLVEPIAEQHGYGGEWRQMIDSRTEASAIAAMDAAQRRINESVESYVDASRMADGYLRFIASNVNYILCCPNCEDVAEEVAIASRLIVEASADVTWQDINPVGLLERLIEVRS